VNEPYYDDGQVRLYLGDCLDVLAGIPDCSIDSIVTDPPYGLAELSAATVLTAIAAWMSGDRTHVPDGPGGFMGREWDRFVPPPGVWDECMRVLKPGGHLLSFAGSRTVDLMTLSVRIAGFEIRDGIDWIFAAGFPKSLNVAKAIDKAAGAQRQVTARGEPLKRMIPGATQNRTGSWVKDDGREYVPAVTGPATEDAVRWEGWGTALRPSHEPIVVARKPFPGTVAANVLEHGTGALNIDGCRVGGGGYDAPGDRGHENARSRQMDFGMTAGKAHDEGRWPPNVVFTHAPGCEPAGTREVPSNARSRKKPAGSAKFPGAYGELVNDQDRAYGNPGTAEVVETWDCAPGCPVAELDAQSGVLTSGANPARRGSGKFRDAYGEFAGQQECTAHRGADTGSASRFFPAFRWQAKAPASERPRLPDGTAHPTVKPLELMRWLVRLVTPPGGTVGDFFAGSGTTGEACVIEGFNCILAEEDPASAELIKARLSKPIQPVMFGEAR
jgi:hypothetical protein